MSDPDLALPEPQISIRAIHDIPALGLRNGDSGLVAPTDAVETVTLGHAELTKRQDRPPFELLDAIAGRLNDLDPIGPFCDEGVQDRFQDEALRFGTRRATIGGKQLIWIETVRSMQKAFKEQMSFPGASVDDVLRQTNECWSWHCAHQSYHERSVPLSREEMLERGTVSVPTEHGQIRYLGHGSSFRGFRYYNVGGDWVRFFLRLNDMAELQRSQIKSCLETGRILAVEDIGQARLIAPKSWTERRMPTRNDNLSFVFSGDLPDRWFSKQSFAKGAKRDALVDILSDWLSELYRTHRPNGKRVTKAQFTRLAPTRLPKDCKNVGRIANDAWESTNTPEWDSGRPKDAERLKDCEVLQSV